MLLLEKFLMVALNKISPKEFPSTITFSFNWQMKVWDWNLVILDAGHDGSGLADTELWRELRAWRQDWQELVPVNQFQDIIGVDRITASTRLNFDEELDQKSFRTRHHGANWVGPKSFSPRLTNTKQIEAWPHIKSGHNWLWLLTF